MGNNEWGIIALPTYLVIIVIIVTAITGVLSYGLLNYQHEMQTQQIQNQIDTIISQAELLYTSSFDDSSIVIEVMFPPILTSLIFGALPQNNMNEYDHYIRDNTTEKLCCYILDNNQMLIRHTAMKFFGENITDPAILEAGRYEIMIKIVIISGESYVKISQVQ